MVKREHTAYRRSTWKVCAECGEEFRAETAKVCEKCKQDYALERFLKKKDVKSIYGN